MMNFPHSLEALRARKEVLSIEPREAAADLPSPELLSLSSFGPLAEDVEAAYSSIYEWLQTPFIDDMFDQDHPSRRSWRQSLPQDEQLLVRKNKYRNNLAGVVSLHLQNLRRGLMHEMPRLGEKIDVVLTKDTSRGDETSLSSIAFKLRHTEDPVVRKKLLQALEEKATEALRLIAPVAKMKRVATAS